MWNLFRTQKVQHCEATWQTFRPERHSFSIFVEAKKWPLVTTDQFFLPRLKIQVKNEAETIPWAQVSVEIAEYSDPSTFSNYQGPFKDVKHFEFKDFLGGQVRTESLTIPSKFLKPATYMIRVTVNKFEPSPSIYEQLKTAILGDAPITQEMTQRLNQALEIVQAQSPGMDIYRAPLGQYQGIRLCDWRLHDVLKVHSFAGPAGIALVIALPAAILAVIGTLTKIYDVVQPFFINSIP